MRGSRGIVILKMGGDVVEQGLAGAALQIAVLKECKYSVVVVTSGAIRAGREYVARIRGVSPESIRAESGYSNALLAGYGTGPLIQEWSAALEPRGIIPAAMLITHGNLATAGEAAAIRQQVIEAACQPHAVPLINENDIVAGNDQRNEINRISKGFGNNDMLTVEFSRNLQSTGYETDVQDSERIVAVLFATRVGGYYTDDPAKNPHASLVPELPYRTWEAKGMLVSFLLPHRERFPNSMLAKVCAAMYCSAHLGIPHVGIARPEQFVSLVTNSEDFVGTRIVP